LLTLVRYVELNPVRARMVERAQDWPWSSHAALTGAEKAPPWLMVARVLAHLLAFEPSTATDFALGAQRYADWVASADPAEDFWTSHLKQQIDLGGEGFVPCRCRRRRCWPTASSSKALRGQRLCGWPISKAA
jgi:putative transposase